MEHNAISLYKSQIMIGFLALIIVSLISIIHCNAQELVCESGSAQIQRIIEVEGKTSTEIYKAVNRWVGKNFHNKDKILIQNQVENEMISGDGYEPKSVVIGLLVYSDLSYSFSVDIKDGKLRLTLSNLKIYHQSGGSNSVEAYCCKQDGSIRTNGQSQKIKQSIEALTDKLMQAFTMNNDDW